MLDIMKELANLLREGHVSKAQLCVTSTGFDFRFNWTRQYLLEETGGRMSDVVYEN